MIRINSTSIIQLLSSSMSIFNSEIADFSTKFIYSSFSTLEVDNCYFHDSSIGNYDIVAIYLENYNFFKISNNKFDTLSNENNGPVNIILNLIFF